MRMLVDVRESDEHTLKALAWRDHRSVREQAAYLLHKQLELEAERLTDAESEAVA